MAASNKASDMWLSDVHVGEGGTSSYQKRGLSSSSFNHKYDDVEINLWINGASIEWIEPASQPTVDLLRECRNPPAQPLLSALKLPTRP